MHRSHIVRRSNLVAGLALLTLLACSSSTESGGAKTGGTIGTGGTPTTGGSSAGGFAGNGGTSGVAGSVGSTHAGGATGNAGSTATGGTSSGRAVSGGRSMGGPGSGGSAGASTGGVSASGGSAGKGTGGSASSGGAASGGTLASGGNAGSGNAGLGGSAGAGGKTGVGGSAGAASGGVTGLAGTAGNATGGTTDTGGTASSTNPCGSDNPATVPLPTIPSATFDVKTYGATGDGSTDDTKALQAALTAAANAGGGTVTVPKGTFLSGPLTLSSSTRLDLADDATLKMLPKASYPSVTPLLNASNVHDIALTGSGTIDGQGQDWWTAFAGDSSVQRPQAVVFSNSTRVLISGVRLQNPPEEHIWVKGDKDLTITGITISTLAVSDKSPPKNTDGVDISADGVFFCNNKIECGDDNVAMSGSNIYLGYSTFGVGHGCSIGSITKSGVSKLTVDHLTMNGTTSGIRMKSGRDRGGTVQNLTYSNITMTNVQNPIDITSYYPTMPTDPTADSAQATSSTTPYWKDIIIQNVTVTGSTNGGILLGLPEAKISNVTFDNVRIQANTGMVIYHATGISFANGSTVAPKSGAAVKVYDADVTGITTTAY